MLVTNVNNLLDGRVTLQESTFGRGWWYNYETKKLVGMDPGSLGPHGDHDGWITIGDHAQEIGVDYKVARAVSALYGFSVKDVSKEFADWLNDNGLVDFGLVNSDDITSKEGGLLYRKEFGYPADNWDLINKLPLVRIRDWGKGYITFLLYGDWDQTLLNRILEAVQAVVDTGVYTENFVITNGNDYYTVPSDEIIDVRYVRDLQSYKR